MTEFFHNSTWWISSSSSSNDNRAEKEKKHYFWLTDPILMAFSLEERQQKNRRAEPLNRHSTSKPPKYTDPHDGYAVDRNRTSNDVFQ